MLVEVAGLSSAGKSTLLERVLTEPTERYSATSIGTDRALAAVGLTGLRGVPRRIALTGLATAGWALGGPAIWRTGRAILTAHNHSCLPARSWSKWNGTLNAGMQLGVLFLLRRIADDDELVLLDTGPLHTVYNFFVDVDRAAEDEAVTDYLSSLPLADVIVWFHQDRDVIIERTVQRSHRRVKNLDRRGAAAFHDHGREAFANLRRHPGIVERLIEFDLSAEPPDPDVLINCISTRSARPINDE
jgi:hypothetical protein